MRIFYADSSAVVKMVREEPESAALRDRITEAQLVSSELVLTEVPRALQRIAATETGIDLGEKLEETERLLEIFGLRPVDRDTLLGAGALAEPALRSLDAIHLVTAIELWPLDGFLTYDERQAAAARLAGLPIVSPGA